MKSDGQISNPGLTLKTQIWTPNPNFKNPNLNKIRSKSVCWYWFKQWWQLL